MPSAAVVTQVRAVCSTVGYGQLTSLARIMEWEAQQVVEPGADIPVLVPAGLLPGVEQVRQVHDSGDLC